jgi:hypothetical protein
MSYKNKKVAVLLALLSVISINAGWDGLVLCIGHGGHIAFEPSMHGRCCQQEDPCCGTNAFCGSRKEQCSACVDFPLPASGIALPGAPSHHTIGAMGYALAVQASRPEALLLSRPCTFQFFADTGLNTFLRTSVLLI